MKIPVLSLTVLLLVWNGPSRAFDLHDPLATQQPVPADIGTPCPDLKPGALTLVDAVAQALCRSPNTRGSWADVQAQAAALGVARAAWLPTLDASASYARSKSSRGRSGAFVTNTSGAFSQTDLGLTLSYLLLDFGGRKAGREQAGALLDAALASHDRDVQQLLFDTVQAFYNLRAAQAQVTATAAAQADSQASLDAAQTRQQLGVATPADVLQAKTAHSQDVLAAVRAEGTLRSNRGQLASVMNLPVTTVLQLAPEPAANAAPAPGYLDDAGKLIQRAESERPDLIAARARVKAAQAGIASARADGRPSVSLSAHTGSSKLEDFGTNTSSSAQLSLSVPLFSGFTTTYRIRQAQAQAAQAQQQSLALRQQIALDVWNSYQQLQTAQQSLVTTHDLVASASASHEVALGRYKAGVGSVLDLLNAQSALADARQQEVAARYTRDTARTQLGLALGSLNLDTLTGTASTGN